MGCVFRPWRLVASNTRSIPGTRKASEAELESLLLERMDRMLAFGTTTMEGKSGYSLETETELKMLRVLHTASQKHPIDIVSTFCGTSTARLSSFVSPQILAVLFVQLCETNKSMLPLPQSPIDSMALHCKLQDY